MSDEPRQHHYLFAHRELPSAALDFGDDLVDAAATGHLRLREAWDGLAQRLPEHERLNGNGLGATYHRLGSYEAVLVRMPLAKRPREAHFALIVRPVAGGPIRYITLARAVSPVDGRRYTVLGEWTKEGHVNHGEGPPPDPNAFLAAASELIGVKTGRLTKLLRRWA